MFRAVLQESALGPPSSPFAGAVLPRDFGLNHEAAGARVTSSYRKLGRYLRQTECGSLAEADALKCAGTRGAFGSPEPRKRQLRPGSHRAVTCCRTDWTADGNIEATEQTKDASAVREGLAAAHALLTFVKLREPGNRGREHAPSIGTVRDVWRPDALDPERLACR